MDPVIGAADLIEELFPGIREHIYAYDVRRFAPDGYEIGLTLAPQTYAPSAQECGRRTDELLRLVQSAGFEVHGHVECYIEANAVYADKLEMWQATLRLTVWRKAA